jgi:hypothetical protein
MPTPLWATEILEEVKQSKVKLKNMDFIENTVKEINTKMSKIENRFK